jgi:hypothetical protein
VIAARQRAGAGHARDLEGRARHARESFGYAAYLARFHTSSALPPPDAAVLVYFISSPVIVTDRF